MRRLFRAALAGLFMLMVTCGSASAQEFAGREKLRAHSSEFRRGVIKVTDGVWVAVGFSNANSVLIEGEGGSIVVDTTSDVEDARAVKAEFAKVTTAPVRAIIYTHAHPDHIGGGAVFAGNDRPEILAHQLFVDRVADVAATGAMAAISSAPRCRMPYSSTPVPGWSSVAVRLRARSSRRREPSAGTAWS